jgi:DNA primase
MDRNKWEDHAALFCDECQGRLWKDEGKRARAWLYDRGLQPDILREWGIGFNPQDGKESAESWGLDGDPVWLPKGIVIPCRDALGLHYVKIRRPQGHPKYFILRGGKLMLYGAETLKDFDAAFLFESELDVLLAIQTGYKIGYASIPAGQDIKQFGNLFHDITDLIVAFDNDERGQTAADRLCLLSPNIHKAQPFAAGKDLTEYYQGGGNVLDYLWDELGRLAEGK